jgi:hypothetical protein
VKWSSYVGQRDIDTVTSARLENRVLLRWCLCANEPTKGGPSAEAGTHSSMDGQGVWNKLCEGISRLSAIERTER